MLLAIVLGFFSCVCFYLLYGIYKEQKEIAEKTNVSIFKSFKKEDLYGTIFIIILTIGLVVGCCFSLANSSLLEESKPSKWNSLTKEEKQWYKDNYGGGKSDAYDKAIDRYKNK